MEVFGILNVTPDSFSDGGRFLDVDAAVSHAHAMRRAGASVIDVGGESTRPGAVPVSADEEISRITDVVSTLVAEGFRVSLDTSKAKVAERGIELGVHYINDVTGGLSDRTMLSMLATSHVDVILMHWRGASDVMDSLALYDNVVPEVLMELLSRRDAAMEAGISSDRIILDPGLVLQRTPNTTGKYLAKSMYFSKHILDCY